MTRHVKIGEVKVQPTEVEAGEDVAAACETLRRERANQQAVTTSEILSWHHEGHTR